RFTGDDGFKKVKGLSGGERNRLTLAKMMLRPRNLLALDEPTNHLDIPAREVLEDALDEYEGTIIVVSHDRYFLDRVVTKIVHIHDGRAEEHVGNYSEWKSRKPIVEARPATAEKKPEPKSERVVEREAKKAQEREVAKKQKRLKELEEKIAGAESEIAALNDKLAADHGGDWTKLHALVADKEKIEQRLKSWMGEWERLGEELEA
ncbi:MAG: ATP-binding cassette domain-containing protein, partial [Polyangia bacterium]